MTDWQPPAEPNQPVPHLAFWQAASKAAEGSTDYEILTAGLLVLRILDRWRFRAKTARDVTFHEFVHVKRKAESLPQSPIRQVLADLVNTISDYAYGTADSRVAKLLEFARLLEESAYWEPAADVYATVIEIIASRPEDRNRLPQCYERQAYCLRQVGEIEKAEELLLAGIDVATELQDIRSALYLRISVAVVERVKGDLPEAEYALDTIIGDAESANETEMVARALQERGVVAHERRQFATSAEFHYAAARLHSDPKMARRALLDAAVALADLGHLDYARKMCRLVRRAPDDGLESRALAGVNLMRYEALANERPTFERLRIELSTERMSGRLLAHYHLFIGQSLLHFGDISTARQEFEQAIALGEQHHLNKLLIETDKMLAAADDRPALWKEDDQSPALLALFEDIDAQRGLFAEATST